MTAEQFQTAYDFLPEPMLLLAGDGAILAANRAAAEQLSMPSGPLPGRRLEQLVSDPPDKVADYLRTCARNRSFVLGSLTFLHPDGTALRCRCQGAGLPVAPGSGAGRLVLRLALKESAGAQFEALNEKVDELTCEIRRRKQAEAEAHQQQERLLVTLASIGDGVMTTDGEGRVTFLNPVAEHLTGWTTQEAGQAPLEEVFRIVNERTRKPTENPVARVIREGTVVGLANHTVLIARDGTERPISDSAAPIRDTAGNVAGVILVFRDVSERRKIERTQAHLAAIIESSDDGIVSKTLEGVIQTWNQGAERIFGYTAEEIVGKPITLLVPPERPGEEAAILERLRRGERIDHFETVRVRKDGTRIDVSVTISPIRDSAGDIIGASKIARDITLQRRRERGMRFLAEASASLAALVDYESTLQKVARLAVPSFADWCAVDLATADGALKRLIVVHPDPAKVELARHLNRQYPAHDNARQGTHHVFRTGQAEWQSEITDAMLSAAAEDAEHLRLLRALNLQSYVSVPLRAANKLLGVITFAHSESGRRFNELDLEVAEDLANRAAIAIDNAHLYQELRNADRRKDEFLAMLAHELRNPLAPVRNAVQVMRLIGMPDANLARARDMIDRQVEHMTRLVDDLLDVSRITTGKIKLVRERVDLATVIARAVETNRPLIEARQQALHVHLPDEALLIEGDATRLAQVLGNLVHNAAKYTPERGNIWLTAERDSDAALVRVRDDGIGIAAELLPRIFDLFTQADRSLDRSLGGLGVGLSLARKLVEMHGGSITARSDGADRGSEFAVRLPLLQAASDPGMVDASRPREPGAAAFRVLVVDDNQDSAESLGLLLKLLGQQVVTVYEGRAALEAVRNFAPHIVFLDIGLPGMSGYDVAQRLRDEFKDRAMQLVAITGYGQAEDRRRSLEAGFDHHLTKPVDPEALTRILAALRQPV